MFMLTIELHLLLADGFENTSKKHEHYKGTKQQFLF